MRMIIKRIQNYYMKSFYVIIHLVLILIVSSCSQTSGYESPNADPGLILKDFNGWWNYNYRNINLSQNYTALDTTNKVISKETFLKFLCSGEYIPLRLISKDSSLKYRLYKLSPSIGNDIKTQIKRIGEDEYQYYKMEGMQLPDLNFTDINGNVYNKETTKGKIVVLKCWFIRCQKCVEEMPALNKAIKQFQNRKDILFISLAFDSKKQLKDFLIKTKFDYAVVPEQKTYLIERLKIYSYPAHLIINKEGLISKVAVNWEDMISSLKREI